MRDDYSDIYNEFVEQEANLDALRKSYDIGQVSDDELCVNEMDESARKTTNISHFKDRTYTGNSSSRHFHSIGSNLGRISNNLKVDNELSNKLNARFMDVLLTSEGIGNLKEINRKEEKLAERLKRESQRPHRYNENRLNGAVGRIYNEEKNRFSKALERTYNDKMNGMKQYRTKGFENMDEVMNRIEINYKDRIKGNNFKRARIGYRNFLKKDYNTKDDDLDDIIFD